MTEYNRHRAEELLAIVVSCPKFDKATAEEHVESQTSVCPLCDGNGEVDVEVFNNMDGKPLGIEFFGIGPDFGAGERAFYSLPELADQLRAAITHIDQLEAAPLIVHHWPSCGCSVTPPRNCDMAERWASFVDARDTRIRLLEAEATARRQPSRFLSEPDYQELQTAARFNDECGGVIDESGFGSGISFPAAMKNDIHGSRGDAQDGGE